MQQRVKNALWSSSMEKKPPLFMPYNFIGTQRSQKVLAGWTS